MGFSALRSGGVVKSTNIFCASPNARTESLSKLENAPARGWSHHSPRNSGLSRSQDVIYPSPKYHERTVLCWSASEAMRPLPPLHAKSTCEGSVGSTQPWEPQGFEKYEQAKSVNKNPSLQHQMSSTSESRRRCCYWFHFPPVFCLRPKPG